MKALILHAAKDLRIEEREITKPQAEEVLIELAVGGICGSDLHYYNHGGFGAVRLRQPMILGHEVSGYIRECGPGVTELAVGDLVAISPSRPCGKCTYCVRGLQNHCENMRFYGSAMPFPHIQGAFRQMLVANAYQCIKAGDLSASEAAMAEPLSVCLHAAQRAGDMLGKRVLITGCGPIGSLSILTARAAGAKEIVAADLSDAALDYARKMGADHTINVTEKRETLTSYFEGIKGAFDITIECSGAESALTAAIAATKRRGIIVQLGFGGDMTLPIQALTAKEIDLRGSFRFHDVFANAVELMQKGIIDVNPLISHTLPFEKALQAFDLANDREQAMKVHIAFA